MSSENAAARAHGQCKNYKPVLETCGWRPQAEPLPFWLVMGCLHNLSPWIAPGADATRCQTFEARGAPEADHAT